MSPSARPRRPHPARTARAVVAVCLSAVLLAGCGGDDERSTSTAAQASTAAAGGEFAPIKTYLVEHTERLAAATGRLAQLSDAYYAKAEAVGFDHAALLKEDRRAVADYVEAAQKAWQEANPAYEEAEGVVAGVPSLAQYDVDLDAGSDGKTPADAVSFDVELPDGTVLKKPGNFFFLSETALWGTERASAAKGVKPDLDGDGNVTFGEAMPDARFIKAVTTDMHAKAKALDADAKAFVPTRDDVFNAVVVMTPTMSEYFEAWKNSRFVAGDAAEESGFVGASRLGDIVGILSGLKVAYAGIRPIIATKDEGRAAQTGQNLDQLITFVSDVRDRESKGERFSAEQADSFGTNAQDQAEAIAGQVSQSAAELGVQLEED